MTTRRKRVNVEVTNQGAVYVNGTRITGRHTKWGIHHTVFAAKVFQNEVSTTLKTNGYGHIVLDKEYASELGVL